MRDIIQKIIEKLHTICTSLAGTKTTTDELSTTVGGLSTTVNALGKTIFTTTVTVAEDTVVNPASTKEINSTPLSSILPEGARFVSATLQGGTTALMGILILHETWWDSNNYIGVTNPNNASAITIPAGKTILVVYAK